MRHSVLPVLGLLALLSAGCDCGGGPVNGNGGDGSVLGMDGGGGLDGGGVSTDTGLPPPGEGGVVALPDGGFLLPDGAIVDCLPATCAGRTYQCGDCIDNDGDGVKDSSDPGCIGPCDNSEDVYDLAIPGGDTATCSRDCYYDQDQGSGNDHCEWDERCDPLVPDSRCPFTGPGPGVRCPATQPAGCFDVCVPLVPNGCDCFGCCELPAHSGSFVFLGSQDTSGAHTCTPDTVTDPTLCHPCTPVPGCLNTCGHCELCLGATTLPADCFPPPPVDAGPLLDDAGNPIDAGPPPDGGTIVRCPGGEQACGLPGDPLCPAGYYCLTGCCIFFG